MIITYDTLIRQAGGVVDMRLICIGELSGIKNKKEKHDTRAETYQPSRKLTPIRPSSLKQPYPLDPATSITPHHCLPLPTGALSPSHNKLPNASDYKPPACKSTTSHHPPASTSRKFLPINVFFLIDLLPLLLIQHIQCLLPILLLFVPFPPGLF